MKRFTALLMIFSLLFAVACGASDDAPGTVSEAGSAERSESVSKAFTEQSEESESGSAYVTPESGITFLSAKEFSSDRTAGSISEEFRLQYYKFAAKLLKSCSEGESAFVSPLSALIALQMVTNGAKGKTESELNAALGGNMTTEELNGQLFSLWECYKFANSEKAKLLSANAVWMTNRSDFKVKNEFIRVINNTFDASLACAPFGDPATVDAINDWCKENTDGMIPNILNYDDVNDDTLMVLLNALLFDAEWALRYEDEACRSATFYGEKGEKTVNMMYSDESGYISGAHETGFYKYYNGARYAFLGLLPEEGMSMKDYLATLDGERLNSLLHNARGQVHAGIPEFTFDWTGSLVPALKEMGIETAFTRDADFSGLGEMEGGGAVKVSEVLQKTHIEVDPRGTKAAAVTAVVVNTESINAEPEEWHTVILDRPFVYAVIDTQNGLPVFIGCITDIG